MENHIEEISDRTLERLPIYYYFVKSLSESHIDFVSATQIAKHLGINAVLVRKDITSTGIIGKPKIGFNVKELLVHLEEFLGWKNDVNAIIIGCGKLGAALLSYSHFKKYGLNIVAGFDTNKSIINKRINNTPILNINQMEDFIQNNTVDLGIITTPEEVAQTIAEKIVKNNIFAIWNFAPVQLNVPNCVAVQQQDMAPCLTLLLKKIKNN